MSLFAGDGLKAVVPNGEASHFCVKVNCQFCDREGGVRLTECEHAFCRDCLTMLTMSALDASQVPISCPGARGMECGAKVSLGVLQEVLSPEIYKRYLNQNPQGMMDEDDDLPFLECTGCLCWFESNSTSTLCPECVRVNEERNSNRTQSDRAQKALKSNDVGGHALPISRREEKTTCKREFKREGNSPVAPAKAIKTTDIKEVSVVCENSILETEDTGLRKCQSCSTALADVVLQNCSHVFCKY